MLLTKELYMAKLHITPAWLRVTLCLVYSDGTLRKNRKYQRNWPENPEAESLAEYPSNSSETGELPPPQLPSSPPELPSSPPELPSSPAPELPSSPSPDLPSPQIHELPPSNKFSELSSFQDQELSPSKYVESLFSLSEELASPVEEIISFPTSSNPAQRPSILFPPETPLPSRSPGDDDLPSAPEFPPDVNMESSLELPTTFPPPFLPTVYEEPEKVDSPSDPQEFTSSIPSSVIRGGIGLPGMVKFNPLFPKPPGEGRNAKEGARRYLFDEEEGGTPESITLGRDAPSEGSPFLRKRTPMDGQVSLSDATSISSDSVSIGSNNKTDSR